MTYEKALELTNDSISQGHMLPEQENYSYMYRVREALEKVEKLENENMELRRTIANICVKYTGCEVCPLRDLETNKCKIKAPEELRLLALEGGSDADERDD